MELIKLTKLKIYAFIILLLGLFVPQIVGFLINAFYMRTHSAEQYQNFIANPTIGLIFFVLYLIWLYIIISVIINIVKKK